jgi:hypothetical protein
MERDTYWVKGYTANYYDPFGGFLNRKANLAHDMVESNLLTMHIAPTPAEGQPANFTGAIGQFAVTGDVQPTSIAIGEPCMLYFSVEGVGNFDYVRCPTIPDNPAWKAYVPTSKITYREARTTGVKMFEQAIIPKAAGVMQLPSATFSYFDPDQKKYVTLPVGLSPVNVTGSAMEASAPQGNASSDNASVAITPPADGMSPNRLELGSLYPSLTPVYRHAWFWIVQASLVALPLLGLLLLLFRVAKKPDLTFAEREKRDRSRQQEESAMAEAVQRNDAAAFFIAARHAAQLQLGSQWGVSPESLTLREIRTREPELAARLEPLFVQADEVIYSGRASSNLDLAEWQRRTRELLQPQPA